MRTVECTLVYREFCYLLILVYVYQSCSVLILPIQFVQQPTAKIVNQVLHSQTLKQDADNIYLAVLLGHN